MNQYEKLIEHIINDETDKARSLFHTIVVEKSRDIYENLVYDEDLDDIGGNKVRGLADEINYDEQGMSDGEEDLEDGIDSENEFDHDEVSDEEGEEAELEDRVVDLESALDELKAEFDQLMAGEEHEEEEEYPGIHGEEGEEFGNEDEEDEDEEDEDDELDESIVREYVDKIGDVYKGSLGGDKEGKTVGTGGDAPTINAKGTVAGKNDFGGTASNIARGGSNQSPDGTSPRKPSNYGTKGETKMSNDQFKNAPGKKSVWDKREAAGHGAEKKSGSEGKLAGNDGSIAINKKSEIGGKVR